MPERSAARISRRQLSLLLIVALGLWAASPPGRVWGRTAAPHERLKRLLERTLSDPVGARAIGRRFLESDPDAAADALALAERLRAKHPVNGMGLRRALARYRDDDLRRGRFVLVDGWILPRLEVQVCALVVLL
jgi:hypothetical protein